MKPEPAGLRPYRQVFAPFLCGMFAFIDLCCTQPLLPFLSRVFHTSAAKVSWTISASTLGVANPASSSFPCRLQNQFLYSPVEQLGNIKLVFRRTGNFVDPSELFELLAGLSQIAEHLAIKA
jgi:hypothetical protein